MDTSTISQDKSQDLQNDQKDKPIQQIQYLFDNKKAFHPLQEQIDKLTQKVDFMQSEIKQYKLFNKNVELSEAVFQLRNCQNYIPPFEDCLKNQTSLLEQIARLSLKLQDWVHVVEQHSVQIKNLQDINEYKNENDRDFFLNSELMSYLQERDDIFNQKLIELEDRVPSYDSLKDINKRQVDLVMLNDYYKNRLQLVEKAMNSYSEFKETHLGEKLKELEENNQHVLKRSESIKKDITERVQNIEHKVKISHEKISELVGSDIQDINTESFNNLKNKSSGLNKSDSKTLKNIEQSIIKPKLQQFKEEFKKQLNSSIQEYQQQQQEKDQQVSQQLYKLQQQLDQSNQLNLAAYKEILDFKVKELSSQSETQKKDFLSKLQYLQQVVLNRSQNNNSLSSFDSPFNSTSIDSSVDKLSIIKAQEVSNKITSDIENIKGKLQEYVEINVFSQLDNSYKVTQQIINQIQLDIIELKESVKSTQNNIKKENESFSRENKRLLQHSRELAIELQNIKDRGKSQEANTLITPINKGNISQQNKTQSNFQNVISNHQVIKQYQNQQLPNLNNTHGNCSFFKMDSIKNNNNNNNNNQYIQTSSQRTKILKPIGSIHSRNQTIKNVRQFVNQSLDLLPEVNEKNQSITDLNIHTSSIDRSFNQNDKINTDINQSPITQGLSQLQNKYEQSDSKLIQLRTQEQISDKNLSQLFIQTPTVFTRNSNLKDEFRNKSLDGGSGLLSRAHQIQLKKFNHIFGQQNKDLNQTFRNSFQ